MPLPDARKELPAAGSFDSLDEALALLVLLQLGIQADKRADDLGGAPPFAAFLEDPGKAVGLRHTARCGPVHHDVAMAL